MQLIKIKNIPAEYKFKIESASLEKAKHDNATSGKNSSNIKPNCNKIIYDKVNLNGSIEPSAIELNNSSLEMMDNGGTNAKAVSEYMKISNIIKDDAKNHDSNAKKITPDDTFILNNLNFENIAESIQNEVEIEESKLEFTPASFGVEIVSEAKVEIEYIGGYNYVPPSSSPDYEESEE
ncbi:MAG: hypothetical protein GX365_04620 [Clostridiales bacterium]|nr:hypothetical protein [Clostridiales bacterium]